MKSLIKRIIAGSRRTISTIDYWESRYRSGGNSGSGSYNRLAQFKADFINEFLISNPVQSAIEFGCGDGNQLSLIRYPRYVGLDVSKTSIRLCSERFRGDTSKSFFLYDPFAFSDSSGVFHSDLSLSLDVIYHLVENEVYELYMEHLFGASTRYVIIYSTNDEQVQVNHERNRRFTTWIEQKKPKWRLLSRKVNPFHNEEDPESQSSSDFYIYERS